MEFINQINVINLIKDLLVMFISVFTAGLFVYTFGRISDLSKINKANKEALQKMTAEDFFVKIYHKKLVENLVIDKNLDIAYEEYRYQNSIFLKKAVFYFLIQIIFLITFIFIMKYINHYQNFFFFIPIIFGTATLLLFSNLENVYNKLANIRLYIKKIEDYKKHNLMDFFENGFYKQKFNDDRNIFITFISLAAPLWLFAGIFLAAKNLHKLSLLLMITAAFLFAAIIYWQYKNRKEYKLIEKNK